MNPIAIIAGLLGLLLLLLALLLLRRNWPAPPPIDERLRPSPEVRARVRELFEQYQNGEGQ